MSDTYIGAIAYSNSSSLNFCVYIFSSIFPLIFCYFITWVKFL
uniref:NADH dehydrogenase subunit 1 n=1 Tax=Symphyocladiella dendroidea TaxID=2506487 RepID=A0A1Z1M845_9FLOR|nr:hypothetical protein [Symphyocladiella dendroidea]ARW61955.1 hypothetical protein [Symphyocladiella dendroidea]